MECFFLLFPLFVRSFLRGTTRPRFPTGKGCDMIGATAREKK